MTETQTAYLATVPESLRGIVRRAYERTGGRSNAIKAMCLHCTGYSRQSVRECASVLCPLHPWRPLQPAPNKAPVATDELDDESIFEIPEDDDEL